MHMAVEGWLEHYGVDAVREVADRSRGKVSPFIPTLTHSVLPGAGGRIDDPVSVIRKMQGVIGKRIVARGDVAPDPLPEVSSTDWVARRIQSGVDNTRTRLAPHARLFASDRERLREALDASGLDYSWFAARRVQRLTGGL